MATSHIGSITGHVINFIKTKLSFLASILISLIRLLFPKPQAATTHTDELNKSQDGPSSIKGMTAFLSPNINKVSVHMVQVKDENEMYRSRFDIYLSLCQHKLNARCASITVSRIPATFIKASCIIKQEKQCVP